MALRGRRRGRVIKSDGSNADLITSRLCDPRHVELSEPPASYLRVGLRVVPTHGCCELTGDGVHKRPQNSGLLSEYVMLFMMISSE